MAPAHAGAVDFTDTDRMYGWNGSAQFFPTWAEHIAQLESVTWVFTNSISVPGVISTAPDGAHYLDINNGVAITATATAGFLAYLTDRYWVANGANWTTRYLLDSSFIGSVVQAWDADLDSWALISPSTGSINTTGNISGAIVTDTDADAHTLTEAEYHGGSVLATGAGVYTLPTAAAGRHGCVETGQGITAIIQLLPASGDFIVHEGSRGTVATAIASDGSAGDRICYRAYNTDDWYVSTFGTWAE